MDIVKKTVLITVVICLYLAGIAGVVSAADRMVIGEMVTNTGCPPCYAADLALDRLVGPDSVFFTLIRYHWYYPDDTDPFYRYDISENMARNNYYGNNYSPHLWIDGNHDLGADPGSWGNGVINESNDISELAMTLSGTYYPDSLAGYLNVDIIVESNPALNNIKLRVVLIQSGIHWPAPNGTQVHGQTFRDIFPSTAGLGIPLPEGDTLNYTIRFIKPSIIPLDSSYLVAFVQSDQNRHIIQGSRIAIRDMVLVGVEDGQTIPKSFALSQNYPNPFNAQTHIDFSTAGGNTALEIFDVTGDRITSLVQDNLRAGAYSVIWDGNNQTGNPVASGTYFYRLKDDSGIKTMRMTLLK
jgi:hypothetical protein